MIAQVSGAEFSQTVAVLPADGESTSLTSHGGGWVLAATILGSSMAFIDGTAVTVALPAMQTAFHASANEIQWIVESYALFLASLLLLGGSLGDLYGRRLLFGIGVLLFALGSGWCGLGNSITSLITARALQGAGAALLLPGSLSLITASFNAEIRGKAIGIWSGASAMTAAVGPVLGGWLVDRASWRWVFFINLPIALAILAIAFTRIPESRDTSMTARLDWPGAVLATVALAGITFALIEGRRAGSIVALSATVGGLCLIALIAVEARSSAPMLPLSLFRSCTFTGANLITLFLYTALSGLLFFFPLDLIQVQHYSATAAGAALLPLILTMFFLSRWSGELIGKYGARGPLTIGPLVAGLGFALAARPGIGGSYWTTFFPAVAVLGLGMAISVAPLTTAVLNAVPVERSGTAAGVNNAISRLAGLLSVALFGVVLLAAFHGNLGSRMEALKVPQAERQAINSQQSQFGEVQTRDPRVQRAAAEAFVFGFRRIIWFAVALCVASSLSAQLLSSDRASSSPKQGRASAAIG